jgi:hypothetical protein
MCNEGYTCCPTLEIQRSLNELITYDEFSSAIDSLRQGSATGPSETTPNMILSWIPAIRRFVYTHTTFFQTGLTSVTNKSISLTFQTSPGPPISPLQNHNLTAAPKFQSSPTDMPTTLPRLSLALEHILHSTATSHVDISLLRFHRPAT